MMKTNFHTHTYRCGHAIGNEAAMIKSAIKNDFDILGMCCHVPLPHYRRHLLKGLHCIKGKQAFLSFGKAFISGGPSMRMPYNQKKEHLAIVASLKDKYKDTIKIYQGFEAEYFEEYIPYYKKMLDTGEIDYLILGNHFNKYAIHSRYYGKPNITDQEILQYRDDLLHALDTDLFSYIAHPDLFMIGKKHWDSLCENVAREICLKAKEKDVPLEVNAGGMRRGLRKIDDEMLYPYPNDYFWKVVSEVGNKVVLGFDAHSPEELDQFSYELMQNFVKKHNLNVVDTFEFKKGHYKK